jgi:hypothetical protein
MVMFPADSLYNFFETVWCFVFVGLQWGTLSLYQTYINSFRLIYDYVSRRGHAIGMYIKR